MTTNFFTDMLLRIIITVTIEEGLLCWLLLARPKNAISKNAIFITIGMIAVTIVSLGIQLAFVMQRFGIT